MSTKFANGDPPFGGCKKCGALFIRGYPCRGCGDKYPYKKPVDPTKKAKPGSR
jgi:hypothetical protein